MAETTQWTPGPWTIRTEHTTRIGPEGTTTEIVRRVVDARGDVVAVVEGCPWNDELARADARLISASTELYAELAGLVDVLERLGRLDSPRVIAARAALAKARGETPRG